MNAHDRGNHRAEHDIVHTTANQNQARAGTAIDEAFAARPLASIAYLIEHKEA